MARGVLLDWTITNKVVRPSGTAIWVFYFQRIRHDSHAEFHTSLQWSDQLSLGVFAQNLLNDRGYVSPDVIEDFAARSRPRTYGIEFASSSEKEHTGVQQHRMSLTWMRRD